MLRLVIVGLVVGVVIAAMFITAEYGRGLIRNPFTEPSRRDRCLLAARILVIGAAAFAAVTIAAMVRRGDHPRAPHITPARGDPLQITTS